MRQEIYIATLEKKAFCSIHRSIAKFIGIYNAIKHILKLLSHSTNFNSLRLEKKFGSARNDYRNKNHIQITIIFISVLLRR